jgi:hypothetical protein
VTAVDGFVWPLGRRKRISTFRSRKASCRRPKTALAITSKAGEYIVLFDKILTALQRIYSQLRDTRYDTNSLLQPVTTALSQLMGPGVRTLVVARHDEKCLLTDAASYAQVISNLHTT